MAVQAVAHPETRVSQKQESDAIKLNLLKMLGIWVPACLGAVAYDLSTAPWRHPLRSPMDALDLALQNNSFATSEIGHTLTELKKGGNISNDNFLQWSDAFFDPECFQNSDGCGAVFQPENLSHPIVWGWTSADNAFVAAQYTTGNKTNNCTLTLFQTLSGNDQRIEPGVCLSFPLDSTDNAWIYDLSCFFPKKPEATENENGVKIEVVDEAIGNNPGANAVAADKSEVNEPVANAVAADKPEVNEPVANASAADKSEVNKPVANASVADKLELNEPVANASAAGESENIALNDNAGVKTLNEGQFGQVLGEINEGGKDKKLIRIADSLPQYQNKSGTENLNQTSS